MKYYKLTTWRADNASTMETEAFEELGQAMVRANSIAGEMIYNDIEPQYYRWRIDNENPFIQRGAFEVAVGRYDENGHIVIIAMRTK